MINLTKGQKIDLTKKTNIKRINVGLGWDEAVTGRDIDCDASCALLKNDSEAISKSVSGSTVYFGNKNLPGIKHSGDNLTGGGKGDDETIEVDLEKVQPIVNKIVFFMNIYKASQRSQDFSMLKNAYIRVYNPDNSEELCRFELDENMGKCTGIIAGEIYRHEGEWKFAAIGEGVKDADYITSITKRWGAND